MAAKGITVVTWNVNYDFRAEGKLEWAAFHWEARRESVIQNILKKFATADFVCLQELRSESVRSIIGDPRISAVYDSAYGRTNATENALCLLTLWDKKAWSCVESSTLWFGPDYMPRYWSARPGGNGYGRIVFLTRFMRAVAPEPPNAPIVHRGEHPISICNVHFGLSEAERMQEARLLHEVALCRNAIVCGDFNSFVDAGGAAQLEVALGKEFADVIAGPFGRDMNIQSTVGKFLPGIQVPYPYDTFVKFKDTDHPEVHPLEGEVGGPLDHILFCKDLFKCPFYALLPAGMIDAEGKLKVVVEEDLGYHKADKAPRMASDHIPLVAILTPM
jgi:endonuclease/exonuclease/phosphatase family metal-dependent hydrolase